ncbi:hypothetical protein ZWY2020_001796 [Hordeum vulgare]|nr:hypothetical protein ZWY2020_001796 [Hordeum vulgare]
MGLFDGLFSGRCHDGVRMGNAVSSSSAAAAAMATDDAASASASTQQCSDGLPPLSPTATSVVHRCAQYVSQSGGGSERDEVWRRRHKRDEVWRPRRGNGSG